MKTTNTGDRGLAATGWPTVGTRVAEYRHGVEPTIRRVARLTDTLIVLEGTDHRYRRGTLGRVGAPYGWTLRPLTDVDVAEARAVATLGQLVAEVERTRRAALDQAARDGTRVGRRAYEAIEIIRGLAGAALDKLNDTADRDPAADLRDDVARVLGALADELSGGQDDGPAGVAWRLAGEVTRGETRPEQAVKTLRATIDPHGVDRVVRRHLAELGEQCERCAGLVDDVDPDTGLCDGCRHADADRVVI